MQPMTPRSMRNVRRVAVALALSLALFLPAIRATDQAEAVSAGDNGRIAFVRDGTVRTVQVDGSDEVNLTGGASGDDSDPVWSPDGLRLAWLAGGGSLVMADADGSDRQTLVETGVVQVGSWSPAGDRIVIVDAGGIAVVAIDGSGATPVPVAGSARMSDPVWSPVGDEIAAWEDVGSRGEESIVAFAPDGSGKRTILATGPGTLDSEWLDWSPDGQTLVYSGIGNACSPGIALVDHDGTNGRQLLYGPDAGFCYAFDPAWSPDGEQIVFVGEGVGGGPNPDGIYVMDADDGSGVTLVVADDAEDSSSSVVGPAWQPVLPVAADGSIAYIESGDVRVLLPDGATAPITATVAIESAPAWSPDGRRLAWLAETGADLQDIVVAHSDGSHPMVLTAGVGCASGPAWSPDGTTIASTRCTATGGELFTVPVTGGAVSPISGPANDAIGDPAWSPDGSRLAFSYIPLGDPGGDPVLATMNVDGSHFAQVPGAASEAALADWHPSGQRLAYEFPAFSSTCAQHVRVIETDGTRDREVRNPDTGALGCGTSHPTWNGDGSRLAYRHCDRGTPDRPPECGIFTVEPDGNDEPRRVLRSQTDGSDPDWFGTAEPPAIDDPGPEPAGGIPLPTDPLLCPILTEPLRQIPVPLPVCR